MIIDMKNNSHASIGWKCRCTIDGKDIPRLTVYVDDEKGILKYCEAKENGSPLLVKNNETNEYDVVEHTIEGTIEIHPPEGMTKNELEQILNS